MTITNFTVWRAFLSEEDQNLHLEWLDRGCEGEGRIIVENENLSEAKLPE
jgi:hypothetical protein